MGRSHALTYHHHNDFQIVGLVIRSQTSQEALPAELKGYKTVRSFDEGLLLKPQLVAIATHVDTDASYAIQALHAGSHVFVEKPLAATVDDARRVVDAARAANRKLVVGYLLRHHPSWQTFVRRAQELGPPFVMRMNLNQRSTGAAWDIHKRVLHNTSPVVDCGVHYLDIMLQITRSRPVQVRGMGVRLSEEISADQVNYGHLQVLFADGSVGWYEAGWGPMISSTAHFVKDVMGPRGAVSITGEEGRESADVEGHTKTAAIKIQGLDSTMDELLRAQDEPDHDGLCALQQQFILEAIRDNLNLDEHMGSAVHSLQIVLAADESMRQIRAIDLPATLREARR